MRLRRPCGARQGLLASLHQSRWTIKSFNGPSEAHPKRYQKNIYSNNILWSLYPRAKSPNPNTQILENRQQQSRHEHVQCISSLFLRDVFLFFFSFHKMTGSSLTNQALDKLEVANQLLEVADGAAKKAEARLADATSRRASAQVRLFGMCFWLVCLYVHYPYTYTTYMYACIPPKHTCMHTYTKA